MSLFEKHRPKTFRTFVGNRTNTQIIESGLKTPGHAHAQTYLFHGPSGCGKTTAAYICANIVGASGGDILVVNAADDRGVEAARKIININQHHPMGKARVWILDEVHSTNKFFQEALLKITEAPPENCYFFLCTTEPQALIPALQNRCSKFEFPALSHGEIEDLLSRVSLYDNIFPGDKVIAAIISHAEGSARQALVLLEQVISLNEEQALEFLVSHITESEGVFLGKALLSGNEWNTITPTIQNLPVSDIEKVRRQILGYAGAALLNGTSRAARVIHYFKNDFFTSGKAGFILACYSVLFGDGHGTT